MKTKKEFLILILVILALGLYLTFRTKDKTHYQLPKLPQPAKSEITKIEITRPKSTLLLEKKSDQWLIQPKGYLADPDQMKGILDVISGLSATELVSESKNYVRYDLDKNNRINVKAWAGDSLKLDFDMGKTAPSQHHTFFRMSDDFRVYYAKGNFRDLFDKEIDGIRDKTVLQFDQNEIHEVEITKAQHTVSVVKKQVSVKAEKNKTEKEKSSPQEKETAATSETSWETPDGKKADNSVMDTLLSSLSHLKCESYLTDKEKKDLSEPIFSIKLKGSRDYTLSLFSKPGKEATSYPAVSSENEYPFQLPKYKAEEIMKGPEDVLKATDQPSKK